MTAVSSDLPENRFEMAGRGNGNSKGNGRGCPTVADRLVQQVNVFRVAVVKGVCRLGKEVQQVYRVYHM